MGAVESFFDSQSKIPDDCNVIRLPNHYSCCFINSVTQSLLNLDEVQKYLLIFGNCVIKQKFQELFQSSILWNLSKIYMSINESELTDLTVNNTSYLQTVYSHNNDFTPEEECDAHEFLISLISSFDQTALQFNELAGSQKVPLFSSLFDVKVTNFVQCGCGHSFSKIENYNVISVQADFVSLPSCLDYFLKPNKELARKLVCHKDIEGSAFRQFTTLPKVFVLHFMRFVFVNNSYRKNGRMIPLMEKLAIRTSDRETHYVLQSVVIHLGKSINSGHYVTVYRSSNRRHWILADDKNAKDLSDEEIEEFLSTGVVKTDYCKNAAAYLMFYEMQENC